MKINSIKSIIVTFCLGASSALFAQSHNVSINLSGTTSTNPAILDLSDPSNNHLGFLMTNVSLTSITDAVTIPSPTAGMIVWNTNASMPNGVGYYYWSGSTWYYIFNSGSNNGILNQNTSQQTANYWISGPASIGAANTTDQLYVAQSNAANNAINGANTASDASSTGNGVQGTTNQSGGYGVYGGNGSLSGIGVYGVNTAANGSPGSNSAAGVVGSTGSGGAAIQGYNNNIGYFTIGVQGFGNWQYYGSWTYPFYGAGVMGEGLAQGIYGTYPVTANGGAGVVGVGTGAGTPQTQQAQDYGALGMIGSGAGAGVAGYSNGLQTWPTAVGTAGLMGYANGNGNTYGSGRLKQ